MMSRAYKAIAEYYDAEYESNDVLDHDVPFLLNHLPKKSQRILELATGTGRAAIPLAEAGHRVTGVEIDPAILAIAQRKAAACGLSEPRLRLVRGDVLKPMSAHGPFDWAVILFNTLLNFTTLAEQDRLLAGVAAALKPRGRFWIDVFNPDLSMLAEAVQENLDVAVFHVPAFNRSVTRTTEIHRGVRPQTQRVTFHYAWIDETGDLRRERVAFDMTWMMPRELTLLLARHGFTIERMYGDYDASEVRVTSPRIIVQARKTA